MANITGKKYGGRQKGTPNRMTKELRSILKGYTVSRIRRNRRKTRCIRTKNKNRTSN